jgi:hypothetical protein
MNILQNGLLVRLPRQKMRRTLNNKTWMNKMDEQDDAPVIASKRCNEIHNIHKQIDLIFLLESLKHKRRSLKQTCVWLTTTQSSHSNFSVSISSRTMCAAATFGNVLKPSASKPAPPAVNG